MAQELDLRILPAATKDVLSVSLGAAWITLGAARKPGATFNTLLDTGRELVKIPEDAEPGLRAKAEAMAGVWMEKVMNLLNDCKVAGLRFTEGK